VILLISAVENTAFNAILVSLHSQLVFLYGVYFLWGPGQRRPGSGTSRLVPDFDSAK
jgi:hypothetical protein